MIAVGRASHSRYRARAEQAADGPGASGPARGFKFRLGPRVPGLGAALRTTRTLATATHPFRCDMFHFSPAHCGRAGPALYQLHLVHSRRGSSPLRGHSHSCRCRSVIFSRSSKVLLSRIYSINASLRERLAAPVLGFSWNSVPIFYCACWIAVGLATLSAFLSVLHLCRPATLLVDFSCYNFSSTLLRCPTNSSHSPNCLPHFASATFAARLFFSLFHLLEFPLHSVLGSLLAPVG